MGGNRFLREEDGEYDDIIWCQQCHLPRTNDISLSSEQELAIVAQGEKYGLIHREYFSTEGARILFADVIICPCAYDTIYQLHTGGDEGCFISYLDGKCCLLRVFCDQFQDEDYVYCRQVTPCSYDHIACEDREAGLLALYRGKEAHLYSLRTLNMVKQDPY